MKVNTLTMLRRSLCSLAWLAALPLLAILSHGCLAAETAATNGVAVKCMADGRGFFRARISGSIKAELDWGNDGTECTGATRPSGGVRVRFSHAFEGNDQQLVFLFGIPGFREGQLSHNLPVNLTVILQGAGQFYGTTGDDKCMIDELRQETIVGVPHRNRSYRVIARGFCLQPAPAIRGKGSVFISRFDFLGRIDFTEEDAAPDEPKTAFEGP